jgi:predicted ATPase
MDNFKLIGIRPHKECGEKFLKILEPGRLYQFYNEYEFYTKKGKFDGVNGEITHYEFKKTVPEDLYKVGNLNVNISAVVGKNGTGKSSLIELLLYAIYILGISLKDKNTKKPILMKYSELLKIELKDAEEKLKLIKDEIQSNQKNLFKIIEEVSTFSEEKNQIQSRINEILEELKRLNYDSPNLKRRIRNLKIESVLNDENLNDFRCSLFYVCEGNLYELSLGDQIFFYIITSTNKKPCSPIDLNLHFFYSTILNYSHHALNSNHIGFWINSLFHKNDGYKTPAVINPMRDEGNFDINKEIELSKSRLLVNSLFNQLNDLEKLVPVSDKQYISSLNLKQKDNSLFEKPVELIWDSSILKFKITGEVNGINTIEEILITNNLKSIVEVGYDGEHKKILENLMNYLINKVHKIQKNYSDYFDKALSIGIEKADQIVDDRNTIKKLNSDFSHVSFKYHRSIYYLQKIVSGEFDDFLKDVEEKKSCSLRDYLFKIGFLNEENEILEDDIFQIFLRVPPPIFDVDINISNSPDSNNAFCKISDLSSGEQQNIHTINTFIYHLNNTYSVHKESVGKRQKYQFFNAVFDEIELYFHPDYQRRFINDLLRNIENNKHLIKGDYIKGINLIFSTHSPFILSDIPEQNILKLEYDKKVEYSKPINLKGQTFGANIHDLLASSFFLENGSMGEYAKTYIDSIYEQINCNEINENTFSVLNKKIDLIGEDLIKDRLEFLLNQKYGQRSKDQIIEELRDEINRLRDEKN